ncbi:MAG TPA: nicotinate phosphoribosyltransferase [Ignavibacteriaceae bacterium]|nr:nicotinate phosphoribosyltransferase [Ignavibacteriaceae bacterium]
MEPIIDSILQTDLYKLSMQQAVLHQYPNATVKYVFKCRNEGVKLGFLANNIRKQVEAMKDVCLADDEWAYLSSLQFLTDDYFSYLDKYRFNPSQVKIENVDGELKIEIEGPWAETILYEVPLLAIVNELYFDATSDFKSIEGEGIRRLKDKINLIRQYPTLIFAEFGTRRRYSRDWQKYILEELHRNCPQLVGTSNVKLAMDFGIKPIGTVAHEWFSCHLALVDRLEIAQKRAMHVWQQEYGTDLGIILSDTFTVDAFLKDFDLVLAREFSGCRHDSGDPIVFGNKIIKHYKKLGIDPKTKSIVFSDGLDIPEAIRIFKEFTGRIGVSFGIGTSLSNDLSVTPLNIVIKVVECNGQDVVKLSDNPGKAIGDKDMIERVKKAYGVK